MTYSFNRSNTRRDFFGYSVERTGRYAVIFKLLNQFERLTDKQQLKWLQNLDRVNIQTHLVGSTANTSFRLTK